MEEWKAASYRQLASGISAKTEAIVFEYADFPGQYRLLFNSHLAAPTISLEFTLLDFAVLRQALSLLEVGCADKECHDVVTLGQFFGRAVTLAQDEEWFKRFYVVIRDADFPLGNSLYFKISGSEVDALVAILQEIVEELEV